MRLINVDTLELEEFFGTPDTPQYAILSHTWGKGEVSFHEWQSPATARIKRGWKKITSACKEANQQQLQYLWCDTNCINKSSSAELTEAINSMFAWYRDAAICFVYLDDVETVEEMKDSRWFTRGWTLQELLAPANVKFYNKQWQYIGSKSDMVESISDITGIYSGCLIAGSYEIRKMSVACKMSWLQGRKTTRVEDIAYCMLGIFDLNMSLQYGERFKAFHRLQEEILRVSDDQTIFAWSSSLVPDCDTNKRPRIDLIAPSPSAFAHGDQIFPSNREATHNTSINITNAGLVASWLVLPHCWDPDRKFIVLEALQWGKSECYQLVVPIIKQHVTGSWVRSFGGEGIIKVPLTLSKKIARPTRLEELVIGSRTYGLEAISFGVGPSLTPKNGSLCEVRLSLSISDTWQMLVLDGEYDSAKQVLKLRPLKTNRSGVKSWAALVVIFTACPASDDQVRYQSVFHFHLIDRRTRYRLYYYPYPPNSFRNLVGDIVTAKNSGCTSLELSRLRSKCKMISQQLQGSIQDDDNIMESMRHTVDLAKWNSHVIKIQAQRDKDPGLPRNHISCVVELSAVPYRSHLTRVSCRRGKDREIAWPDPAPNDFVLPEDRSPLISIGSYDKSVKPRSSL